MQRRGSRRAAAGLRRAGRERRGRSSCRSRAVRPPTRHRTLPYRPGRVRGTTRAGVGARGAPRPTRRRRGHASRSPSGRTQVASRAPAQDRRASSCTLPRSPERPGIACDSRGEAAHAAGHPRRRVRPARELVVLVRFIQADTEAESHQVCRFDLGHRRVDDVRAHRTGVGPAPRVQEVELEFQPQRFDQPEGGLHRRRFTGLNQVDERARDTGALGEGGDGQAAHEAGVPESDPECDPQAVLSGADCVGSRGGEAGRRHCTSSQHLHAQPSVIWASPAHRAGSAESAGSVASAGSAAQCMDQAADRSVDAACCAESERRTDMTWKSVERWSWPGGGAARRRGGRAGRAGRARGGGDASAERASRDDGERARPSSSTRPSRAIVYGLTRSSYASGRRSR